MFSYRHAFHAGNHADVLKHAVLVQLLHYLNQKDKPYMVLDTHAGAGRYNLDSGYAQKNEEFDTGITRLWGQKNLPPLLADYLSAIEAANPPGTLRYYPGSPYLAKLLQRPGDQLRLYELHPSEIKVLQQNMGTPESRRPVHPDAAKNRPPKRPTADQIGPRVFIEHDDGFAALKAVLPPTQRRGLVLIDPPYEDKNDYIKVIKGVREGLERFATGMYAVWYPQVQRNESKRFPEQLMKLPVTSWVHVALTVQAPSEDGFGLNGSGMYVANPPWTLVAQLKAALPYLVKTLGQDAGAKFELQYQES